MANRTKHKQTSFFLKNLLKSQITLHFRLGHALFCLFHAILCLFPLLYSCFLPVYLLMFSNLCPFVSVSSASSLLIERVPFM